MSASDADSSIFLADTDKQIQKKIGNSFSGGQDTRELHRQLGGRTEIDIPFQYLRFFLEDDVELERIRIAYEKGEMESGEIKKICTKELQAYVAAFRERRKIVSEEVLRTFLTPRALEFRGSPFKVEDQLKAEQESLEKRLKELRFMIERDSKGSEEPSAGS
jgi:tryptophanyl-tRNA synthetase